jgi:hypothetical protein
MARDLERRKATRHRYYLANKDAFRRRDKKWRDGGGQLQVKIARGLGIPVSAARALMVKDEGRCPLP